MEATRKLWDSALPSEYLRNELVVRAAMAIAIGGVVVFVPPFKRRVQPEDWLNYRFPYTEHETFPALPTAGILVGLPILNLIYFQWLARKKKARREIIRDSALYLLALSLSLLSVILLCETVKRMYGRPRPDFLSRCFGTTDPKELVSLAQQITTDDPLVCDPNREGYSQHTIEDGRMSFPSEHSATSFSVFTMMAEWDFMRIKEVNGGSEALILPGFLLLIPLIIAISRTSDYRHHASDVLAGILIGCVVATGVTFFYFRKGFSIPSLRTGINDPESGGSALMSNNERVESSIDIGTTYRDDNA